jgi:hypothetical protein
MDPDPDPGGPKTYGSYRSGHGFRSGSATLVKGYWHTILNSVSTDMYLDLDSIRSLEKDLDRIGIIVIDKRGSSSFIQ